MFDFQVNPKRYGYKSARGVPDSVIWFKSGKSQFPFLIELESKGTFFDGLKDVKKYAKRSLKREKVIRIPYKGSKKEHFSLNMSYYVQNLPLSLCGLNKNATERKFHKKLISWTKNSIINNYISKTRKSGNHVNYWDIQVKIFTRKFRFKIPFLIKVIEEKKAQSLLKEEVLRYSYIPALIATSSRNKNTQRLKLNTGIEICRF